MNTIKAYMSQCIDILVNNDVNNDVNNAVTEDVKGPLKCEHKSDHTCVHTCVFNNNGTKCNKNRKYGDYCHKHRKLHLLRDNILVLEHFTSNIKDYTKKELIDYYCKYLITKGERKTKLKKEDCFLAINKYYHKMKEFTDNDKIIIKLQGSLRRNILLKRIREQGIGVINRSICNNDEDFYTYTPKEEIEDIYFFSYKDSQHNVWCFDIRSLKKLIDMNYDNPYTTEEIPNNIKCLVKNYMNKLIQQGILEKIVDTTIRDRETAVKQKLVDIFSQMEFCGYSCDIQWILSLNIHNLKKLYRQLEDIWNYRANLSEHVKISIAPPDGRLFTQSVHDVMSCTSKIEVLETITSNIHKILNAHTPDDMRLGFMYFLVGLSVVSRECLLIHSWVQYVY